MLINEKLLNSMPYVLSGNLKLLRRFEPPKHIENRIKFNVLWVEQIMMGGWAYKIRTSFKEELLLEAV